MAIHLFGVWCINLDADLAALHLHDGRRLLACFGLGRLGRHDDGSSSATAGVKRSSKEDGMNLTKGKGLLVRDETVRS